GVVPTDRTSFPVRFRRPSSAGLDVVITGVQVEVGEFASSYIPTGNSQVTRAADLAVIPAEEWVNRDTGTFIITANTEDISRRNPLSFANPILSLGGPDRQDTLTFLTTLSLGESGTGRYTGLTINGYPTSLYSSVVRFQGAL